jgi:hypothetical protein
VLDLLESRWQHRNPQRPSLRFPFLQHRSNNTAALEMYGPTAKIIRLIGTVRYINQGKSSYAAENLRSQLNVQFLIEAPERLVHENNARRQGEARASATRCCSPPDSSPGLLSR